MVRVPLAIKELTEIRVRDEENIGMGYLVQGKAKATRFNHKITWHISSQNPANPPFRTHQYQLKQISDHNSCTHNPTALVNMSTDWNTFHKIIKNSTVFYHVSPKPLRTTNLYVILYLNFLVLHKPQSHCTLWLYIIQSLLFPSDTNASST